MSNMGREGQYPLPERPSTTGVSAVVPQQPSEIPPSAATTIPISYDQIVHLMTQMPLLTKQTLYVMLKASLEQRLSTHTLEKMDAENLLQLWVPQMTHMGMQTLHQLTNQNQTAHPLYRLLRCVHAKQTISQICVLNGWSLAQGCMLVQQACEKEWLLPSPSNLVMGAVHFITGQIRLGEFLLRLGKISAEQLDQALKTQQYAWEVMGQRSAIGNILMNLGYVTKDDIEGILLLKQESKRPLYMSV
jgi:hypothetical protein